MKKITDEYYKVSWEVKERAALPYIIMFVAFNCIEGVLAFTGKSGEMVTPIWTICSIVLLAIYFLAYKMPCIRWDINWKRQDEIQDITERQEKYRDLLSNLGWVVAIITVIVSAVTGNMTMQG